MNMQHGFGGMGGHGGPGARLQQLDFWSDFGKGFQVGFDTTSKLATQAAPICVMMGMDLETCEAYNAALGVANGMNGVVQGVSFDLMDLHSHHHHHKAGLNSLEDGKKHKVAPKPGQKKPMPAKKPAAKPKHAAVPKKKKAPAGKRVEEDIIIGGSPYGYPGAYGAYAAPYGAAGYPVDGVGWAAGWDELNVQAAYAPYGAYTGVEFGGYPYAEEVVSPYGAYGAPVADPYAWNTLGYDVAVDAAYPYSDAYGYGAWGAPMAEPYLDLPDYTWTTM